MIQDSSVNIVTGSGLDSQGLISDRSIDFPLCLHVQTSSGAHSVSYPVHERSLCLRCISQCMKLTSHFQLEYMELYLCPCMPPLHGA